MSSISTSHSPVIAMFVVCILLGISQADDKPVAGSLTHYRFNGNAKDANNRNPDFELQNTEFKDNALYLNGRYDLSVEKDGYRAICKTSELDIERFAVALKFKAEKFDSFTEHLFAGGATYYRWFGLERSQRGNLVVTLNHGLFRKEVKGAALEKGKWTVVACSVDIPGRKVITAVNGKNVTVIDLPEDFEFLDFPKEIDGIVVPKEYLVEFAKFKTKLKNRDTEKEWTFTNYANGGVFHGLVDELIIYGRALSAEELENIPLRP